MESHRNAVNYIKRDMFKESYHKAKLIMEQDGFLNESSPKCAMFHMIKEQYEGFIKLLEEELKLNIFLNEEISKASLKESTKRNIDLYDVSLKRKLAILKEDNCRLKESLKLEEHKRSLLEKKHKAAIKAKQYEHLIGRGILGLSDRDLCQMLHMTLYEWADPTCLIEKLGVIQKKKMELENDLKFRYAKQSNYQSLLQSTLKKEAQCETLGAINSTLKTQVKRLKLAIEAAQISAYHEYPYGKRNDQSMASIVEMVLQNFHDKEEERAEIANTINDQIKMSLLDDNSSKSKSRNTLSIDSGLKKKLDNIDQPKSFDERKSFFDDDPMKEQEAEMTMDFVEHFSLLFSSRKFKEAAFHAIYPPKGVLRTPQTLKYFKELDTILKKKKKTNNQSYLLHYCKLLMSTIDVVGKQPSTWETIECFKCAISEDCIDLAEYWLAKDQVTVVEAIGHLLLNSCKCTARKCCCKNVMLAEVVFRRLAEHYHVVNVLVRQERYATALSYAKTDAQFTAVDFARMLEDDESCSELSYLLITLHKDIHIEEIIVVLVASDHEKNAIVLSKHCVDHNRPPKFGINHFAQFHDQMHVAERFTMLCFQENLQEIGYDFMSACILSHVINNGSTAAAFTSN